MGTEDEEKLEIRSISNDWVPRRLLSSISEKNFCYLDQGIEVHLPLLKDDTVQIQFIIAWASKTQINSSLWFAVDQSAKDILKQIDFY